MPAIAGSHCSPAEGAPGQQRSRRAQALRLPAQLQERALSQGPLTTGALPLRTGTRVWDYQGIAILHASLGPKQI